MKIIPGEANVKSIVQFAEKMLNKITPYYDDYYFYESIVRTGKPSKLLSFVEDDVVVDLATYEVIMNIPAISPFFVTEDRKAIIDLIRQTYGDDIILYGNYEVLSKQGLFKGNMSSTYRDEWDYHIGNRFCPFWVFSEDKRDIIRDAIENRYLQIDLDKHPVRYEMMTMRDAYQKYLRPDGTMEYPREINPGSFSRIAGFHYFGTMDNEPNAKMIIAVANNTAIGCVKYCYYEMEKNYGLCYIDVAKSYRGNGIATRLIHELSLRIENDYPLYLSDESEMGKLCHIKEHFQKEKWPCGLYARNKHYGYERIA